MMLVVASFARLFVLFRQDGPIEYKRQVNRSSAARLRSLKTQMSFRLDQGHGTCLYRVGVEDDGCHSLLDYAVVAKSCCILEYLARSLNAVVTERVMIQNEVVATKKGNFVKLEESDGTTETSAIEVLRIREPTILGDSLGRKHEISPQDLQRIQQGGPTRAELTIQLVQTHVLDPPPVPLSELDTASLSSSPTETVQSSSLSSSSDMEQKAEANGNGHAAKAPSGTAEETKTTDVGETMSARNLRVAVVGNVDAGKSTLIGVSVNV